MHRRHFLNPLTYSCDIAGAQRGARVAPAAAGRPVPRGARAAARPARRVPHAPVASGEVPDTRTRGAFGCEGTASGAPCAGAYFTRVPACYGSGCHYQSHAALCVGGAGRVSEASMCHFWVSWQCAFPSRHTAQGRRLTGSVSKRVTVWRAAARWSAGAAAAAWPALWRRTRRARWPAAHSCRSPNRRCAGFRLCLGI